VLPAFGNPHELTDIEERLAQAPDDVSLLFARAFTLDMLGRNNEARDAYIEVIKRDGTHIGALGNLGTLLYNAGYRSAARLTYNEALKHHPRDLRTLINLGNALLENDELPLSRDLYERALEVDPQSAPAHQGLSHVLGRLGEHVLAEEHRRAGFEAMPVVITEAFFSEGGGNTVGMIRPDGYQIPATPALSFQGVRVSSGGTGQWLTPDMYPRTLDNPLSQRAYTWVGNNPVSYSDPTGFVQETCGSFSNGDSSIGCSGGFDSTQFFFGGGGGYTPGSLLTIATVLAHRSLQCPPRDSYTAVSAVGAASPWNPAAAWASVGIGGLFDWQRNPDNPHYRESANNAVGVYMKSARVPLAMVNAAINATLAYGSIKVHKNLLSEVSSQDRGGALAGYEWNGEPCVSR
jgi:Flp pilus assembly protein TadD